MKPWRDSADLAAEYLDFLQLVFFFFSYFVVFFFCSPSCDVFAQQNDVFTASCAVDDGDWLTIPTCLAVTSAS